MKNGGTGYLLKMRELLRCLSLLLVVLQRDVALHLMLLHELGGHIIGSVAAGDLVAKNLMSDIAFATK